MEVVKHRQAIAARLKQGDEFRLKNAGDSVFCFAQRDETGNLLVYQNKEYTGYWVKNISVESELVILDTDHIDVFGEPLEGSIWLRDVKFIAQ